MTDKVIGTFEAGNSLYVEEMESGSLRIGYENKALITLKADEVETLEQYFQAKADAQTRRWHWPEHHEFVVYATDEHLGTVIVFDEANPRAGIHSFERYDALSVSDTAAYFDTPYFRAARAYFETHPDPNEKPWHNAQPGELWVLTIDGQETEAFAYRMNHHRSVMFQTTNRAEFGVYGSAIKDGRLVWSPNRNKNQHASV